MISQDILLQNFDERIQQLSLNQRDGVVLVNAEDVTPEPIDWIWKGWLARGKLQLLAGPPGQGKTTIAMSFAAVVSSGARWPDGTLCECGNVVIWSAEDDVSDTLVPRLIAAGDRSRCFFVKGTRRNGEIHPFDPAEDIKEIEKIVDQIGGIKLLILDPIVTAVKGDSHMNTEVRRGLQPLVDFATKYGAAILGITHFSKGTSGADPASRVTGSIAFSAVARGVLVAQKVRTSDGVARGVLAKAKANSSSCDGGFSYSFEQVDIGNGVETSRIVWGDALQGDAHELLSDASQGPPEGHGHELQKLLLAELESGPVASSDVLNSLERAGYSKGQINRCAAKLGIKKVKVGMSGGWNWSLHPEDSGQFDDT